LSESVECWDKGKYSGWCFHDCRLTLPIYMSHVFTTMQTAAIVRVVFIKTTKKWSVIDDAKEFLNDFLNTVWQEANAIEEFNELSSEIEQN
jgi:hypothetical protein